MIGAARDHYNFHRAARMPLVTGFTIDFARPTRRNDLLNHLRFELQFKGEKAGTSNGRGYTTCYNFWNMTLRSSTHSKSGTTIIETLVAATLIAGFFGAIFEMNNVCLHYINASKESVAALQGVQNR